MQQRPGARPELERIATIIDAGLRIEVFEGEAPAKRLHGFDALYRYQVSHPSGERTEERITIEHHYIPPARIAPILKAAGLVANHVYGAMDRSSFDDDSDVMVVVAKPDEGCVR